MDKAGTRPQPKLKVSALDLGLKVGNKEEKAMGCSERAPGGVVHNLSEEAAANFGMVKWLVTLMVAGIIGLGMIIGFGIGVFLGF